MKKNRHTQATPDEIIKRDEIFGWNFPLPPQNSGSGWKIIDIRNLLQMKSSKGWNFWMKFSTSTQNSGSGWKIINRHNQLWMKSSKEIKFVDENVHFHSKCWVWMKHNQRKQTNSGWNHQKRLNLWMKMSTSTQNAGSGWNIININKPNLDEIIKRDAIFGWKCPLPLKILGLDEKNQRTQTNSGWNHQKRWIFWMKMCHSWMKKQTRETNKPTLTSTSFCNFYLFLRYVAKPT